ncbi:DUF1007 family protein [Sedimentitalea nanhaiensis]|nr:DUF1007 family protein [Sedimentitalea nanhaiensis]
MARFLVPFLCLMPLSAAAHPHIFVDVGFDIVLDDAGSLTHLRVTWAYDDYYSLLITQDLELDQDFDGALTAEETDKLTGFDMQWVDGFNGDLEATLDDVPLDLSRPTEATAALKAGRIITTHVRSVAGAPVLAGHALSLKPYDATYYTAYEIGQPVKLIGGAGCMLDQILPDVDAQLAQMREMLLEVDASTDLQDAGLPKMGAQFATEIRVSCPAS